MTVDEFFEGRERSRRLYDAIQLDVERLGNAAVRVGKSQIAFRRKRNFAIVWVPGKYLTGKAAPLVLTLSFPHRDNSRRWKEVVRVGPKRFTHHLEIFKLSDIDAEVLRWLKLAWDAA
jgi:hypothetical protein